MRVLALALLLAVGTSDAFQVTSALLRASVVPKASGRSTSSIKMDETKRGATPPLWHLDKEAKPRPNIPVSFEDVCRAAHAIKGKIVYTALLNLPEEQRAKGVIAASAGNHALGLAYHSKLLGIPVTVVMPETAPITKVFKCRKLGANVVLHGAHIGEAKDHALSCSDFNGMQYINGYDDPAIVAGAGSIGLEILEQEPDVDAIVVPVGGAGLIAGIALAAKSVRPSIEIIGVEPERCASYSEALKKGTPSPVAVSPTLADGLAVPTVGPHAFEVARHFVDRVALVNEKMVALAVLRLVEYQKAVVEGGGAAGLAALLPGGPLYGDVRLKGKKVVVPLCGGNIDTSVLGRVIERGLAADKRLVKFESTISDRPGGIARLTRIIADTGASIWDIQHERAWLHESVDQVKNVVTVELTGTDHLDRLRAALEGAGYPIKWFDSEEDKAPQVPPDFAGYRGAVTPNPKVKKGVKKW